MAVAVGGWWPSSQTSVFLAYHCCIHTLHSTQTLADPYPVQHPLRDEPRCASSPLHAGKAGSLLSRAPSHGGALWEPWIESTDLTWSEHGQAKSTGNQPPHLRPRLAAVGRAWEQWWRVQCSTPRARYQRDHAVSPLGRKPALALASLPHQRRGSVSTTRYTLHGKQTAAGASVPRRSATNPTAWQSGGGVDS